MRRRPRRAGGRFAADLRKADVSLAVRVRTATWDLRGKSVTAVRDLLDRIVDFDVLALQEVGGLSLPKNSWELDPFYVPDFAVVATSASDVWLCKIFAIRNTALCFLRSAFVFHSCGRWQNPDAAVREAVGLLQAYRAETSEWTATVTSASFVGQLGRSVTAQDFGWVASCSHRRCTTWRFREPPVVQELVALKHATVECTEKEKLSRRIAELRAQERAHLKAHVLRHPAEGHPSAIRHLQRKKRLDMLKFSMRHHGSNQAVVHLKGFMLEKNRRSGRGGSSCSPPRESKVMANDVVGS